MVERNDEMDSTTSRAFFEAAELASRVLSDAAVVQKWTEPSAVEGFSIGGLN